MTKTDKKHCEWIITENQGDRLATYKTGCGDHILKCNVDHFTYCPNCGKKIKERSENA